MKNWFAAFLLLPFSLFAQDCKLKEAKDPFTHVAKLSTGFQNFSGDGLNLTISADATPTEIDFFLWVKGENRCFDTESTALVLFDGERTKATFRNSGSMNCDGTFHFSFKNTAASNSWLKRLATKKVTSIKLTGSGGKEMSVTLSEEQKDRLLNMAACISTEGKTLIKQ